MSEYLTVDEVAASLRVSEKTIYRLLRQGRLPATRVGRAWRLHHKSIEEWLRRGTVGLKHNVLVIDDDATIGSLFRDVLEEWGHKVVTVETGFKALELLKKQSFDQVFLDLQLPDIDGAMLLRRIKSIKPGLSVTIITGYPDSKLMSRAFKQGPIQVIHKPFGEAEILAAVNYSRQLQAVE